mmetsp:Transcript_52676/g.132411  ORF Transcript_52676/g.132411 Transcript_52676/m.132411 type:complete len:233 (-) Transcript_52676:127-825(-)
MASSSPSPTPYPLSSSPPSSYSTSHSGFLVMSAATGPLSTPHATRERRRRFCSGSARGSSMDHTVSDPSEFWRPLPRRAHSSTWPFPVSLPLASTATATPLATTRSVLTHTFSAMPPAHTGGASRKTGRRNTGTSCGWWGWPCSSTYSAPISSPLSCPSECKTSSTSRERTAGTWKSRTPSSRRPSNMSWASTAMEWSGGSAFGWPEMPCSRSARCSFPTWASCSSCTTQSS